MYSFPTCMLSRFSHMQLQCCLWTTAHQAPLSVGFSRQGYWREVAMTVSLLLHCFPIAALFPYCCTVSLYTAPQTWWLKHICYSMVLRPEAYHLAKPRCQLSCASPGGSKEYPFPCLFQYLEAARIPRLAAPPSRGESSPSIVPTLFLPSYPLCLFSFLFPYLRTLVIIWGPHG